MRRSLSAALAPLALLALAAAPAVGQDGAAPATAPDPAPTVAPDPGPTVLVIDGVEVPELEYTQWLLETRGEQQYRNFGRRVGLRQRAAERGVELDRAAVDAAFEAEIATRLESAFGGDRERWAAELAIGGRSIGGYRVQRTMELEFEHLARALAAVDRVVPEEKVVRDWEKRYGPDGRLMSVRGIFLRIQVTVPSGTPREERERVKQELDEAAKAELNGYRERVLAGEEFALLAMRHSQDAATAPEGGLFDGPFQAGSWPGTVVGAIRALEPGGVTEPWAARGGWWIFELVNARVTPLETVRDELLAALVAAGPENDEISAELSELDATLTIERGAALDDPDLRTPDGRAETAVVVDGQAYTLESYAQWLRRFLGEQQAMGYVEQFVIERAAEGADVEPTPEEIEARALRDRDIAIDIGGISMEEWRVRVGQQGLTPETWRRFAGRRARLDLLCEGLLRADRAVSEAEVRSLWIERYGEAGRTIEARLIAVDVEVDPPRGEDETDREWDKRVDAAAAPAIELLTELRQRVLDGEDFGALARRHSTDAESAPLGGVPPGGFDTSIYPDDVRTVFATAPVGEVTEPLRLDARVLLFEVVAAKDVPFDAVRDELRAELIESQISTVELAVFRNGLLQGAEVTVQPAMFR